MTRRSGTSLALVALVAGVVIAACAPAPREFVVSSGNFMTDITVVDRSGAVTSATRVLPTWDDATIGEPVAFDDRLDVAVRRLAGRTLDIEWMGGNCAQTATVLVAPGQTGLEIGVYPGKRCMTEMADGKVVRLELDRIFQEADVTTTLLDAPPAAP